MKNHLYHFFPRKFEGVEETVSIVRSILENGLYLSKEMLHLNWKDIHAVSGRQRKLEAEQFRFCLTAISNEVELKDHADRFGAVGLEFNMDDIVRMGGFPVFYVPTPKRENASIEEYNGISLLYRIADAQQIFEYIVEHKVIQTNDIDLINVLGAIKFLANICYPTQRKPNSGSADINYYKQREWRIIYNLTSKNVTIGKHFNNYTIQAFDNIPIRNYITSISIAKNKDISQEAYDCLFNAMAELMHQYGLKCELDRADVKQTKY